MLTASRRLSVAMALALAAGETAVVLKYGKYWPLSADDYAIAALLAFAAWATRSGRDLRWLVLAWALAAGNLWAMLFTRLDPVHGSGERVGLVAVALVAALGGLGVAMGAARGRS